MADFRKLYLALSASALVMSFAGTASAQLTCNASATPLTARVEGQREPLGDVRLDCTGGTPTVAPTTIPQVNITVRLSQPVAVRQYGAAAGGIATDALLLINEPPPGGQNICAATVVGGCTYAPPDALGGGGGLGQTTYTAAAGRFNAFQGIQTDPQTLQFLGVPLNAPGGAVGVTPLVIRITNLRAVIGGTVPVTATISTSVGIPINSPSVVVAYPQQGLPPATITGIQNFLQCVSQAATGAFTVNIKEGFATASRSRVVAAGTVPSILQGTPGQNNNTESMFFPAVSGSNTFAVPSNFGLADFGTRYAITLAGVPGGVTTITVPTFVNATAGTGFGTLHLVTSSIATSAIGTLPLASGAATLGFTVPAGGSITLVYEVGILVGPGTPGFPGTDFPDPFSVQNWAIPFSITYNFAPGPPSSPATTTTAPTITVAYAPGPEAGTATTAPSLIPAFTQANTPLNTFTISSCSTTLLFPFVSNQATFDTGIAISATGTDPFGIYPTAGPRKTINGGQGGICILYMYGNTSGTPSAPPTTGSLPTIVVPPATSGTTLISIVNPGFQGYMFAQCNFQYAHGYAFISDGYQAPARGESHGYLALIIPDPNQFNRSAVPFPSIGGAPGEQLGY